LADFGVLMFRGQYIHKISSTGRVSLPSRFRDILKEKYETATIIISLFDKCAVGYPLPEWKELESKISKLPQFKKDIVEFERYLIGSANECEIDTEGRIMVPSLLRKSMKIKGSVVFVGMLSRFEIWSEKEWDANNKTSFSKFQKSRESINDI
jgi:MraZ protein|tara:strand:- start:145 stop:603 length:459 start_codon:yes stop_codon:yes gene_type:complete